MVGYQLLSMQLYNSLCTVKWLSIGILSVHFNDHFSRWTWSASTRISPLWNLLALQLMEVVVTTGAIACAKLQSNHHHQQTITHLFCRPYMPFLSPSHVRALKGNGWIWNCASQTSYHRLIRHRWPSCCQS